MSEVQTACPSGGGPPINTDIGGIGVRISFYLQALFLGLLSVRSDSQDQIADSLRTLLATNAATAFTGLFLGLKTQPEISFHDGLIMLYLISLSWVTTLLSLSACQRIQGSTRLLQLFSLIQSLIFFSFAFALLSHADTFGSSPECNHHASLVLFRPFKALSIGGRVFGWIVASTVVLVYAFMAIKEYLPPATRTVDQWMRKIRVKASQPEPDQGAAGVDLEELHPPLDTKSNPSNNQWEQSFRFAQPERHSHDTGISGPLIVLMFFIILSWAIAVSNTELLIRWNHFNAPGGPSSWQFGQILPMLLVVLPFVSTIKAYKKHGIWRSRLLPTSGR
ncbi:hypothetical protein JAAARDRAFT_34971 [Jaapia argillacea MUCL 33604]|uniref:Uncharacterized protein n=1 Tax=Jaapia argillacea MUCL 33604 TaxID=933084 RepID=A0A067PWB0_9AGAM|nr:hypothetical protein JAAARDRAFT_34971 [Jaapia argillacea MUCL 33604]